MLLEKPVVFPSLIPIFNSALKDMQKPQARLQRILIGLLLVAVIVSCLFLELPHWLVVDESPGNVEIIVVLGGGGGDRLNRGLQLQIDNPDAFIVLVGRKPSDWYRNARSCETCYIEENRSIFLSGSLNTLDDALMVRNWCQKRDLKKIAVVTDPYHTRRSKIIFTEVLKGLSLEVATVSSGVYKNVVSPEDLWWDNPRTLKTVLTEFGKIVFWPFMASGKH